MLANWLSQLKWALVIAAFVGPAFAFWSYSQAQTFRRVMADGVEVSAVIDGGESSSGRRSGTTYTLHAIWKDDKGAERAEDVEISSEYARKVIDGDYLLIEAAGIRYLPGEPESAALIAEDGPQRIADEELMMYLGAGVGVLGLAGAAILFLAGRRKAQAAGGPGV